MKRLMAFGFCLSVAIAGTPADLAIRGQLPNSVNARRVPVSETFDLVVALTNARVGLFLQHRETPGLIYRLADEDAGDCTMEVDLATARTVLLACFGDKGLRRENRKFLIDVRAKAVVRAFSYAPFRATRVFADGGRAVFVAALFPDGERVAIEYRAPDRFRVLAAAQAKPWITRAEPDLSLPPPIPQSSYDDFARARPRRVSDGYARAHTTIAEYRGPAQREGTRLWFGKSFYDAEGHTGVGGFGVYDEATRRFEMFALPEMADWSASAILVEPAAIWFGIGQCGEWGGTSGGLLRYDRATRSARRTETRGAVSGLARLGGELLAATSRGIAIFRGEAQQFYLLDRTTDGRIVVVSPE
ncbi:MAG: hypothetical protein IT162_05045 [Bryobacterales bacterium]|nr:hypothetical protein [Bryobacterales bacterium]